MNIDATAEITKFDLPPIPRFLCAYVGDEWFIVARGASGNWNRVESDIRGDGAEADHGRARSFGRCRMNLSDIREAIDGVLFTLRDGMEEDDGFRSGDVVFSEETHRMMVSDLRKAIEMMDAQEQTMNENNMTTEARAMMLELVGLRDQIQKQHYLNVHFRAFKLAHAAWMEHIRQNAVGGSRAHRTPPGAVLDGERAD